MKINTIETTVSIIIGMLILSSLIPIASASLPNDGFNDGLIDGDIGDGGNNKPNADAGGPYDPVFVDQVVNFDGSGSSDSDGTIVSYSWDFDDGNTGSGETVTHSYDEDGEYTVTLTVENNDGDTDTDTATIVVEQPDPPYEPPAPYAEAGGPYKNCTGSTVCLIGKTYLDGIERTPVYRWDFGDGDYYEESLTEPPGEGIHRDDPVVEYIDDHRIIECPVGHSYASNGFYTATFTVSDGRGQSSSDDALVLVGIPTWDPPQWWTQFNPPYIPRYGRQNPDPNDPETSFEKKVYDEETQSWGETTTVMVGQKIQFKINFTANRVMDSVVVNDLLPATIRYDPVTSNPSAILTKLIYVDPDAEMYCAFTNLRYSLGSMFPGETATIFINGTVEYLDDSYFHIPGDWPDYPFNYTTKNVAMREYTGYDRDCTNPHDYITKDEASFEILDICPRIQITKTVDPNLIHSGDMVTYTYLIENIGDFDLFNIELNDDKLGPDPITCPKTSLVVGENMTCTVNDVPISEDTTNTAIVTGETSEGYGVTDEDDASVDVITPDISVIKTVNPTLINSGEQVTWNITVENTGDTTLYDVFVEDTEYGTLDSGITLAPDEKKYYEYNTNPVVSTTNYVDVNGTDILGLEVTNSSSASVCVEEVNPDISILKTVTPDLIHPRDTVTWNLTVENTGDVVLYDVEVVDTNIGTLVSGLTLAPGEFWYHEYDTMPDVDTENFAEVTGYDPTGFMVYDNDTADVEVINPDISVVKTAVPMVISPGEQVTWNVTVENIGDTTLYDVVVEDTEYGILDSGIILAPDEKKYYEYNTNPVVSTTNYVDVNGTDILGLEVTDSSSASVCVEEIIIDFDVEKIVKWNCLGETYGDYIYAHVGDWVKFNITIENTGDASLNLTVCDILPENLTMFGESQVNDVPVDPVDMCWTIDNLLPGNKVTILFKAIVDECGEHVNIVNVTGYHEGYEPIIKQDIATVFAICPSISIEKTADSNLVCIGDEVTYNYTVTNTGNHHLYNVFVTDDKISSIKYVSGDTNLDGWLDIDEIWYYEGNSTLFENTTNKGTVSAEDELGMEVYDDDTEFVEVVDCQQEPNLVIQVDKKVKRKCCGTLGDIVYVHQDDWLTFNITVENTGEETLYVFVEDILPIELVYTGNSYVNCIPTSPYVDGNKIIWDIGSVGSSEIVYITFEAVIDCGVCGILNNTVNVNGTYQDYTEVTDSDYAEVFVLCPGIHIEKTANPTTIQPGDEVTYTYEVSNTGNCELFNVVVTDDQGLIPELVSGDDGDGIIQTSETWVYENVTYVFVDTTNTGTVTAEDELGAQVSDEDDAFVDVEECLPPNLEIDVEKTVKKSCCSKLDDVGIFVHESDSVTFQLNVTNTGDTILDIRVEDSLPVGLIYSDYATPNEPDDIITPLNGHIIYVWLFEDVEPDETVVITFRAIPDDCGQFVNHVNVTGIYAQYPSVYAEDEAFVFVLCPGVNIVKTVDKPLINPGELVTYTYEVSNTGNCELFNVVVTDDQGLIPELVSGDDGDGILQTSETWVYENVTYVFVDTTNTGTVTAEDELGAQVSDEDDAFVDVEECGCVTDISIDKKIFYEGIWNDTLDVQTAENHINVTFKITIENTGTCDLENISIIDTYECGIENPRDFTGDFTEYEIISDQIFFSVDEPFTSEADPIVIMFNATIYISTINHVEVLADSTYDETHVCKHDSVTIELNDETPVNHGPYKPVDPNPENLEENVSINPILSVYIEDPDGGTLSVSFYNETDVLLGTVDDVASGTRAELSLSDLEHETWYSWYAVVTDGEYTNTSDVFSFKTEKDTGLDPTVKITTPEPGSIYLRGLHITASFLENALVVGGINITVDADDADGEITNIDFIIDGKVKNSTTNTYYYWNEICFGWYTILVRVTDDMGNTAEDEVDVFMISLGL